MENESLSSSSSLFTLGIDETSYFYLTSIAKWNKFLAWAGIIGCSLGIIGLFLGGIFVNSSISRVGYGRDVDSYFTIIFIVYAILLGVIMIPSFYRLRFSNKMLLALESNDQFTLNEAFANLKSFSKFWGILTIILISFYAIALLINLMRSIG